MRLGDVANTSFSLLTFINKHKLARSLSSCEQYRLLSLKIYFFIFLWKMSLKM